jgi:hypothetical protein
MLPFKLPYKTAVKNLGNWLAVGGAVGSILDPPTSAVGGNPTVSSEEELMKPIKLSEEVIFAWV